MKVLTMIGLALVASTGPQPTAAQIAGSVVLTIQPVSADVMLGDSLVIDVEANNTSTTPTPALVIHLDVTDLEAAGSVDPEDWTSTLSQPIGVLAAGESRTTAWSIQPISPGSFTVYAVALAPGAEDLAISTVTTVGVVDRRSLNPNGILAVVIVMPAAVGLLLVERVRNNRVRSETGLRRVLHRLAHR